MIRGRTKNYLIIMDPAPAESDGPLRIRLRHRNAMLLCYTATQANLTWLEKVVAQIATYTSYAEKVPFYEWDKLT